MAEHRYDPHEIEPRWQERVGARAHLGGRQTTAPPTRARARLGARDGAQALELLRARDAALPERRAAHRPPEVLRGRRRDRPLPPPPRPPRAAPDGLRRLRAAGREPRDQDGRAPARCRPPSRSPPSSASSARGGSRSTGRASSRRSEPSYYRWTQWIFLELFRAGLAYRKEAAVKWCPNDQTVLANEQVDAEGRCERCGALVEVRQLEQWFLRITDYAERLLERPRRDRLARARQDDAAQLDRAQRGRRGDLPLRGARRSTTRSSRPARTRCSARPSS